MISSRAVTFVIKVIGERMVCGFGVYESRLFLAGKLPSEGDFSSVSEELLDLGFIRKKFFQKDYFFLI